MHDVGRTVAVGIFFIVTEVWTSMLAIVRVGERWSLAVVRGAHDCSCLATAAGTTPAHHGWKGDLIDRDG